MNFNQVLLGGNLTRNPELKNTQSGKAVCKFGLAINRNYIQNGQRQTETTYVNCVAWGKTAENIERYCQKGSPVFVDGRITMEEWTDKTTGKKRSSIYVTADSVQFLDRKPQNQNDAPQQAAPEHRYTRQDTVPQMPPIPPADEPPLQDDIPF